MAVFCCLAKDEGSLGWEVTIGLGRLGRVLWIIEDSSNAMECNGVGFALLYYANNSILTWYCAKWGNPVKVKADCFVTSKWNREGQEY